MIPILTRFGSSFLFSYSVVLALGVIIGLALTAWLADGQRLKWWDGWLAIMVFGWLGSRLTFVLINWDYYATRPSALWQPWRLGLTYHGALLGGLFGLWLWCRWHSRSFAYYAALFAPALALVTAFGWAACWFEGCAYGAETTLSPLAADLPDEYGVFAVRYQTQMAGVFLSLLIFTAVLQLRKRLPPGVLFWLTLLCLSLVHLLLTLFRGDALPQWNHIRLDTWLNLLLVLISLILLQYERKRN